MAWLRNVEVQQIDLVPRGALRDPDDPGDTARYLVMKEESRDDHTEFRAHEHSHAGRRHVHAHSHKEGEMEHEGDGHGHESLAKRDFDPNVGGGVDRDKLPAADFAGKDRSFPIVIPQDVKDAADSIGRAGPDNYDDATLKANIIRIAKRKGPEFVARLPKAWREGKGDAAKIAKAALAADGSENLPHDVFEKLASLAKEQGGTQEQEPMTDNLAKAEKPTADSPDPDGDGDNDTSPVTDTDHDYWHADGTPTAKGKAVGFTEEQGKAMLEKAKMEKSEGSQTVSLAKADFDALQERLAKADELASRLEEAERMAKAERDIRLDREFLAKAESLGHLPGATAAELGPVLREISEKAPEAFGKLEAVLQATERVVAKGELFRELGSAASGTAGSALGQLKAQAAVIAKEEKLTPAQAMAEAQSRSPELYQQYRTEQRQAARMN